MSVGRNGFRVRLGIAGSWLVQAVLLGGYFLASGGRESAPTFFVLGIDPGDERGMVPHLLAAAFLAALLPLFSGRGWVRALSLVLSCLWGCLFLLGLVAASGRGEDPAIAPVGCMVLLAVLGPMNAVVNMAWFLSGGGTVPFEARKRQSDKDEPDERKDVQKPVLYGF